jgi:hypothetical protein
MATEIPVILLALEGVEEREHHLFTMIFAAAGHQLPPLPRKRIQQRPSAEAIKGWAAAVNARLAANKRAKAARAAGKPEPQVRPGGGAPARKSRGPRKTPR